MWWFHCRFLIMIWRTDVLVRKLIQWQVKYTRGRCMILTNQSLWWVWVWMIILIVAMENNFTMASHWYKYWVGKELEKWVLDSEKCFFCASCSLLDLWHSPCMPLSGGANNIPRIRIINQRVVCNCSCFEFSALAELEFYNNRQPGKQCLFIILSVNHTLSSHHLGACLIYHNTTNYCFDCGSIPELDNQWMQHKVITNFTLLSTLMEPCGIMI